MARLIIPSLSFKKPRVPTAGAAPGTLVPPIERLSPRITRTIYSADRVDTESVTAIDPPSLVATVNGEMVWVDIRGLGDGALIESVGEALGLHPLIVEDIVHVHQRPKKEVYDDHLFVVMRALRNAGSEIDSEQVSFVLKDNLLVTFQETYEDCFSPVRKRLTEGRGAFAKTGSDYLLYALMDVVVDNVYPVLEVYDEIHDQLDDAVQEHPTEETSRHIHSLKRQLRRFRRMVWPLRELLTDLARNETPLIAPRTMFGFRDAADHAILAVEMLDASRERAKELGDLYMAVMGERTGRVMNLLTVIATIFIPLTFLCGLYGMNFDSDVSPYNMPELRWRFGYPAFLGVLSIITLLLVWLFKKKGFWGGKSE